MPDIAIAELIERYPHSVGFLATEGIRCVRCGEPVWGTLEEAARERGFDDAAIIQLVNRLNEQIERSFL